MTSFSSSARQLGRHDEWLGQTPWCVHAHQVGISPRIAQWPEGHQSLAPSCSEAGYQVGLCNPQLCPAHSPTCQSSRGLFAKVHTFTNTCDYVCCVKTCQLPQRASRKCSHTPAT